MTWKVEPSFKLPHNYELHGDVDLLYLKRWVSSNETALTTIATFTHYVKPAEILKVVLNDQISEFGR